MPWCISPRGVDHWLTGIQKSCFTLMLVFVMGFESGTKGRGGAWGSGGTGALLAGAWCHRMRLRPQRCLSCSGANSLPPLRWFFGSQLINIARRTGSNSGSVAPTYPSLHRPPRPDTRPRCPPQPGTCRCPCGCRSLSSAPSRPTCPRAACPGCRAGCRAGGGDCNCSSLPWDLRWSDIIYSLVFSLRVYVFVWITDSIPLMFSLK